MLIYYFTGTGNTLKAAMDFAKLDADTRLVRISEDVMGQQVPMEETVLGVMCPVYYGCAPRMVLRFLDKLIIPGEPYIFTAVTSGSSDFGANAQMRKAIEKKGKKVAASFSYSYPANNQTSYAPVDASTAAAVNVRNSEAIRCDGKIISERQTMSFHAPNPVLLTMAKAATSAIKPDSDQGFSVDNGCVGCGICEAVCPARNISMINGKPQWNHHCERCTACMQLCPMKSIQFQNKTDGWGRYKNPDITLAQLKLEQ